MSAKLRKFLIGFMSLAVLLLIFMLYSHVDRKPPIDIPGTVTDSNIGDIDGEIGKIGDVGIAALKKTNFIHRNKNKKIDREFGFNELLQQSAGLWEVEKPYLNIYQDSFKCFVSADRGQVRVETAVGRPTPKDATFTSNVIFHILPEEGSDVKESFIYLDDITFFSDKTFFSSEGPVKFISEDAKMLGKGLELVYNEQLERLEFLRIVDLDTLRINTAGAALFSPTERAKSPPAQPSTVSQNRQIDSPAGESYKCVFIENVFIDTPEQLIFADDEISINDIFWARAPREKPADSNVVTSVDSGMSDTVVKDSAEAFETLQDSNDIVISCDGGIVITPLNSPRLLKSPVKSDGKLAETSRNAVKKIVDEKQRSTFIAEKIDCSASSGDIIATGSSQISFYANNVLDTNDNTLAMPVEVTAQKQIKFSSATNRVFFEGDCLCSILSSDPDRPEKYTLSSPNMTVDLSRREADQTSASAAGIEHFTAADGVDILVLPLDSAQDKNDVGWRARFNAQQVDFSASTNDVVATGPTHLMFYTDDIIDTNSSTPPLPVTITAREQTKYLLDSRQVIFEGGCLCSMTRQDQVTKQIYNLSAPVIAVNLASQGTAHGAKIEHLTASGGIVRLATVKSAGEKLLSGIELKCLQFDFDQDKQIFLAAGPGVIKFANAVAHEPADKSSSFSLRKPCWALFEDFDTLNYYLEENRIVVDAKTKKIKIGYVPVIDGEYGQPVRATAGGVQALLYQTPQGQTELSTLFASKGITYEDDENRFAGSDFFYDHKKAKMKINGTKAQPCMFNGVLVDSIQYDLKTGKRKAKIIGPGVMQLK